MQSPSLHLTKAFTTRYCGHQLLGFHSAVSSTCNLSTSLSSSPCCFPSPSSRRLVARAQKPHHNSGPKERLRIRGKKDNVWSVDNDLANAAAEKEKARANRRKQKGRKMVKRKRGRGGRVLVSGAMLMEVETVLQTQVCKSGYNFGKYLEKGGYILVSGQSDDLDAKML